MNSKLILCLAFIAFSPTTQARLTRSWTEDQLREASDLAFVGRPVAVKELDETNSLGFEKVPNVPASFRGVETTFIITKYLKGMPTNLMVTLHHYRSDITSVSPPDGPAFVTFAANSTNKYVLYLVKDGTNRYAPVSGQIDPWLSVKPVPSEAEKLLAVDLDMLSTATGVFDAQFVNLPVHAPLVSCGTFAEIYRGGKATNLTYGVTSMSSEPPEKTKIVKICVCVTPAQPPEYDRTKRVRGDWPRVPRSGSMYFGIIFRAIGESGSGGESGGGQVISNADIDFYELRGMKCEDLPFTIVDRHHETHATPVVIYFPKKFDLKSLKGDVDALSLPDGSIVVYAAIKTTT